MPSQETDLIDSQINIRTNDMHNNSNNMSSVETVPIHTTVTTTVSSTNNNDNNSNEFTQLNNNNSVNDAEQLQMGDNSSNISPPKLTAIVGSTSESTISINEYHDPLTDHVEHPVADVEYSHFVSDYWQNSTLVNCHSATAAATFTTTTTTTPFNTTINATDNNNYNNLLTDDNSTNRDQDISQDPINFEDSATNHLQHSDDIQDRNKTGDNANCDHSHHSSKSTEIDTINKDTSSNNNNTTVPVIRNSETQPANQRYFTPVANKRVARLGDIVQVGKTYNNNVYISRRRVERGSSPFFFEQVQDAAENYIADHTESNSTHCTLPDDDTLKQIVLDNFHSFHFYFGTNRDDEVPLEGCVLKQCMRYLCTTIKCLITVSNKQVIQPKCSSTKKKDSVIKMCNDEDSRQISLRRSKRQQERSIIDLTQDDSDDDDGSSPEAANTNAGKIIGSKDGTRQNNKKRRNFDETERDNDNNNARCDTDTYASDDNSGCNDSSSSESGPKNHDILLGGPRYTSEGTRKFKAFFETIPRKFNYEEWSTEIFEYALADLVNDPVRAQFWMVTSSRDARLAEEDDVYRSLKRRYDKLVKQAKKGMACNDERSRSDRSGSEGSNNERSRSNRSGSEGSNKERSRSERSSEGIRIDDWTVENGNEVDHNVDMEMPDVRRNVHDDFSINGNESHVLPCVVTPDSFHYAEARLEDGIDPLVENIKILERQKYKNDLLTTLSSNIHEYRNALQEDLAAPVSQNLQGARRLEEQREESVKRFQAVANQLNDYLQWTFMTNK